MSGAGKRGEATRAAILENAARLFAAKGYQGTSFGDIATALGMTRSAIYYYYAGKDEVLAALVARTSGSAAEKLSAIRQDTTLDSTAKLRAVTAAIVHERLGAPEQFRLFERSEETLPEPVSSRHRAARRAVLAEVSAVLHDGIISGVFRACDERIGALSVLGMCNWVAWWFRPGSGPSDDAVVTVIADNAVAMFARAEDRVPDTPDVPAALAMLRHDLDYLERLVVLAGERTVALAGTNPSNRIREPPDS